jgi:hypothetical protein
MAFSVRLAGCIVSVEVLGLADYIPVGGDSRAPEVRCCQPGRRRAPRAVSADRSARLDAAMFEIGRQT